MELPFKPMQYDIVICLGVIQHTPNPEKTIKKLYEQVNQALNSNTKVWPLSLALECKTIS